MSQPTLRAGESGGVRYLLSLPPRGAAEAAVASPVLCFLHGYDEAAPAPLEVGVTRHGPLRQGSAPVARAAFIVIAPQLPRAGDIWHRYVDVVDEILDDVLRDERGDPERIYLTGFSFGGNGVFDLAARRPARWAALWAVDPTRPPQVRVDHPAWVSIGDAARWQRGAFVDALQLAEARDATAVEVLRRGTRFYLDAGLDHVGSATHAYADARIYQWLLGHRRSPERPWR